MNAQSYKGACTLIQTQPPLFTRHHRSLVLVSILLNHASRHVCCCKEVDVVNSDFLTTFDCTMLKLNISPSSHVCLLLMDKKIHIKGLHVCSVYWLGLVFFPVMRAYVILIISSVHAYVAHTHTQYIELRHTHVKTTCNQFWELNSHMLIFRSASYMVIDSSMPSKR